MLMVMFVSLVDWYQQREQCRCVWKGDGENCAITTGATKRHLLCADNWDYLLLVSMYLILSYNKIMYLYFLHHQTAAVGEAP